MLRKYISIALLTFLLSLFLFFVASLTISGDDYLFGLAITLGVLLSFVIAQLFYIIDLIKGRGKG
ncbi:hypothetical protein [Bacillus alkalicellulosilyticus]|uniref:hypothetical protein n=1 Tax=Alkalihalobacterium alkalicellulosilyticum TaxID=1912214 RepID=UPI0009965A25|nr:hypothetical protein [Bacillus alkalicellulosilyticus]